MINAMISPIIETHMSSTRWAEGCTTNTNLPTLIFDIDMHLFGRLTITAVTEPIVTSFQR